MPKRTVDELYRRHDGTTHAPDTTMAENPLVLAQPNMSVTATLDAHTKLSMDPFLLQQADIWVSNIFPFLGPGHYFFIATVNHQFKELYQQYFATIQKVPRVRDLVSTGRWMVRRDSPGPAVVTHLRL